MSSKKRSKWRYMSNLVRMYTSWIEPEVDMIGFQTEGKVNAPLHRIHDKAFGPAKNPGLVEVLDKLERINAKLKSGCKVPSFQNAMTARSREIKLLRKVAFSKELDEAELQSLRSDIYKSASRMISFSVARKEFPNLDPRILQDLHSELRKIQTEFKTAADMAPHKVSESAKVHAGVEFSIGLLPNQYGFPKGA